MFSATIQSLHLILLYNAFATYKSIIHTIYLSKKESHIQVISQNIRSMNTTSFCSYARPAQPGPNRTRLCWPCIAAIAGD